MTQRTGGSAWRWGNIPAPEPHLAGLGAGILLQVVRPWNLPWPAWIGQLLGWPLLLPFVPVATHLAVPAEERSLDHRFGAAYRSYRRSVRRYL